MIGKEALARAIRSNLSSLFHIGWSDFRAVWKCPLNCDLAIDDTKFAADRGPRDGYHQVRAISSARTRLSEAGRTVTPGSNRLNHENRSLKGPQSGHPVCLLADVRFRG